MNKVATILLLALPAVSGRVRGIAEPMKLDFAPARQLMGSMSSGCPSTGDAPEILCNSHADCIGSPYCAGKEEDCCCVSYTYPYCGVPTECNPYLQCLPDDQPRPVPYSATDAASAFSLLSEVSECLAEREGDDDGLDLGGGSGDNGSGDSTDSGSDDDSDDASSGKGSSKASKSSGKGKGSSNASAKSSGKGKGSSNASAKSSGKGKGSSNASAKSSGKGKGSSKASGSMDETVQKKSYYSDGKDTKKGGYRL